MLEVHIVVVNEFGGDGDQGDIAREAAVVEPVVVDRGNVIDVPGGVDRDAQGGRPHCHQESADNSGEQQQSGGQHQKRRSLYFPALESQLSRAGRRV